MTRKYSVQELRDLRMGVIAYHFGCNRFGHLSADQLLHVEALLRTYMQNGTDPYELVLAANPRRGAAAVQPMNNNLPDTSTNGT